MVKGFNYTAVVNVKEDKIMKVFRAVKNTFDLTFENYRCGFYGGKSLFVFKDENHYRTFVLHCDLSGIPVYDSVEGAREALVAQQEGAAAS